MQLQEIANASLVCGVKLLLTTASPFQSFIDKPCFTHEFCNAQALCILESDGYFDCAGFYSRYTAELNAGVVWADQGWKNVNHYFQPDSRTGLWVFSSAIEQFSAYMNHATRSMRRNNLPKACFLLGAAAHLLQDLCVPHHARGRVFDGHAQFEEWVREHRNSFAVYGKGKYQQGVPTNRLALDNAIVSADLLDWVSNEGDATMYKRAATILLPLAQRTTAGLFLKFYNSIAGYSSAHAIKIA